MQLETLHVALNDHIATISLNRPEKANAMNATMWQEVRQAFEWVDRTPEARVAVLQANGKLKMPVLALGGDKSFGRGIETMESLQRVAEDVRGGLVHNSGHWVTEEQPEFIASELLKFFNE